MGHGEVSTTYYPDDDPLEPELMETEESVRAVQDFVKTARAGMQGTTDVVAQANAMIQAFLKGLGG